MGLKDLQKAWGGETPPRPENHQGDHDSPYSGDDWMARMAFDQMCREDPDFAGRAYGKGQFLFSGEQPWAPARIYELGIDNNGGTENGF